MKSNWFIRWLIILAIVVTGIIMANNAQAIEPFREFESPEAFAEWGLAQPLLMVSGQDFNTITEKNDCDKQAEYLQRRALTQGYLISQAIVNKNGYIANTYVANTKGFYHVGLLATIGNQ